MRRFFHSHLLLDGFGLDSQVGRTCNHSHFAVAFLIIYLFDLVFIKRGVISMVLFNTCDFWPPRVFPLDGAIIPATGGNKRISLTRRSSKKPMELGRSCVMEAPTRANFGLESESRKPKREEPHIRSMSSFCYTHKKITNHKTMGKIKGFDDFFPIFERFAIFHGHVTLPDGKWARISS